MRVMIIVFIQFENLRGLGYFDIVEVNITLDQVAESKLLLMTQDLQTGYYEIQYQFKRAGVYTVYFYLNGF